MTDVRSDSELTATLIEVAGRLPEDLSELAKEDRDFQDLWSDLAPHLHPEFEAEMIGTLGFAATRPGLAGLAEGWNDFLQPWEAFRWTPRDLLPVQGGVLVLVDLRGRMPGAPADLETESALLWRFRDGKIARAEFFLDRQEALAAVGLDA